MNEALKNLGGIPDGYAEVQVDFFKFEAEGDKLEGRLVNKTTVMIRGNKVGKYTMICAGRRVAFLGGVQLDELMANVAVGNEVWVQYTHREKTGEQDYEMKKFKVFVKAPS